MQCAKAGGSALQNSAASIRDTKVSGSMRPHPTMGKDDLVGKTVKIIKGPHKGKLAQVDGLSLCMY